MRKILAAPLALLLLFTLACGSISKTAYNGLLELKAAYQTANQSRIAYCAPLPEPKPVEICKKEGAAYKGLLAAYETLKTGSQLLADYETTKGADAKTKLKTFLPTILAQSIEILKLAIPPPAPVPQ
jgi:hypothetical protein